jgi:nitroreductase
MDAIEAMKTIGANRSYLPDDVPDRVIYDAVEAARFAPQDRADPTVRSGGTRLREQREACRVPPDLTQSVAFLS